MKIQGSCQFLLQFILSLLAIKKGTYLLRELIVSKLQKVRQIFLGLEIPPGGPLSIEHTLHYYVLLLFRTDSIIRITYFTGKLRVIHEAFESRKPLRSLNSNKSFSFGHRNNMDKAMAVAVSMTTTTTTHCDQTGTRLLARSQTQDNIHKETTTDKKTAATRCWSLMILIDRVFDIEVLVAALFLTCLRHSQVFQQCSLFGNKIKSHLWL